ncbi:MAG: PA2169 family four-helix-bundle protein [Terracidiphilus sp.]
MAIETTKRTLNHAEVEETLRSVVQSLIDGQEGFQKIGEHLKDETLRRYCAAESLKRAQFRGEIEEVLHQEGVHDVKEKGTVGGAVQRTWGDLKAHLGGGDHTLLETAEAGEDAAKKAYEEALKKELPLPVRQLLNTQYAHIETSHDYVKAARDRSR